MNRQWWAVVVIALALAMAQWPRLHPHPEVPARRDPTWAEPWMADCLPGVGPKRLDDALAALRAGRIADLPKSAHLAASDLFDFSRASPAPATPRP